MSADREFDFIEDLRSRQRRDPRVPIGVGDDAALLLGGPRDWLVAADMLIENVHFDRSTMSPAMIGRKALAVNLSDVAAMAGAPSAALVCLAFPAGTGRASQEIMRGIEQLAEEFGVVIVGGDTNSSPNGIVVAVTILAHPTGRGPVLRKGATPGDAICVSGPLGYSLARHHWAFTPRVREAQLLHDRCRLTSMIDLSDGLGRDALHLAEESRAQLVIDAESLPIRSRPAYYTDDRDPLVHALSDGEDFELLFTLANDEAEHLVRDQPIPGIEIAKIGSVQEGSGVELVKGGKRLPLDPIGFEHGW